MKIKELPLDDRPREKLLLRGPQNLSDAELLAILIRTGSKGKPVVEIACELLNKYSNLAFLASTSVAALCKIKGIGKDKAAALTAAFEISRRVNSYARVMTDKIITCPKDVADIFIPLLRDEVKENFIVLCMNSANKIIKKEVISVGNLNSSIVHAREIFKVAIENNSANIILLHNHPSGNAEPSKDDIHITRRLVEAGKLIEIQVFDHIIIAGNSYTSFVEKQLI